MRAALRTPLFLSACTILSFGYATTARADAPPADPQGSKGSTWELSPKAYGSDPADNCVPITTGSFYSGAESGDGIDTGQTINLTCTVCSNNSTTDCYYSRLEGCFAPGTKITMADGSTKPIELIRSGDQIWNPLRGAARTVGRLVKGPENEPLLRITGSAGSILVTKTHAMLVQVEEPQTGLVRTSLGREDSRIAGKMTVVRADALKVGQQVADREGKLFTVTDIKADEASKGTTVYNFEILSPTSEPEDRAVIANGMVTADVTTQYKLNGKKPDWER